MKDTKGALAHNVRKLIQALRPYYHGMSDVQIAMTVLSNNGHTKLTANDVEAFASRCKRFSTGDVMHKFGAKKGNVAATLAILRIRQSIEPDGKGADGTSCWRYVG